MNPKIVIDLNVLRAESDRLRSAGLIPTATRLSPAVGVSTQTLRKRIRESPEVAEAANLGPGPVDLNKAQAMALAPKGASVEALARALRMQARTLRKKASEQPALGAILDEATRRLGRGADHIDPVKARKLRDEGATLAQIAEAHGVSAKTMSREALRRPEIAAIKQKTRR